MASAETDRRAINAALLQASAAMWDAYYGQTSVRRLRTVDRRIARAIALLRKLEVTRG